MSLMIQHTGQVSWLRILSKESRSGIPREETLLLRIVLESDSMIELLDDGGEM